MASHLERLLTAFLVLFIPTAFVAPVAGGGSRRNLLQPPQLGLPAKDLPQLLPFLQGLTPPELQSISAAAEEKKQALLCSLLRFKNPQPSFCAGPSPPPPQAPSATPVPPPAPVIQAPVPAPFPSLPPMSAPAPAPIPVPIPAPAPGPSPCPPSGSPVELLNGNFSANVGNEDSDPPDDEPEGWAVQRATDGLSVYFFGEPVDSDPVNDFSGFAFGATGSDSDSISQNITVVSGCKYQVLYTYAQGQLDAETPTEPDNNFSPFVDGVTLLDAEGNSLAVVNSPTTYNIDYVGVFTAQSDLVTLSFSGRDPPDYVYLRNVQVRAL